MLKDCLSFAQAATSETLAAIRESALCQFMEKLAPPLHAKGPAAARHPDYIRVTYSMSPPSADSAAGSGGEGEGGHAEQSACVRWYLAFDKSGRPVRWHSVSTEASCKTAAAARWRERRAGDAAVSSELHNTSASASASASGSSHDHIKRVLHTRGGRERAEAEAAATHRAARRPPVECRVFSKRPVSPPA